MKRFLTLILLFVVALSLTSFAGGGGDKTAYVGGTENQIETGAEGAASVANEKEFVFESQDVQLIIPYEQVNDLEYGQEAGRRLRVASAVNPFLLFSKKKKHFLTIGWKDDHGQQHAAVFELGKSVIRPTIMSLEAKTGKKVDYEDDEARKSGMGGM